MEQLKTLAQGDTAHEAKVAQAEKEAAEQAEQIYNQQQLAAKGGAPVDGPPGGDEGGIGGVSAAAETSAQQLSPEEEKKQLKADLAKAKADNEAQQQESIAQQKTAEHAAAVQESAALDQQYSKGTSLKDKILAKQKAKSSTPKTKMAAKDLISSILHRNLAQKPPVVGAVQVEQNHIETTKQTSQSPALAKSAPAAPQLSALDLKIASLEKQKGKK